MKLKELLEKIPDNQEVEIYCNDRGKYCCNVRGFKMGFEESLINSNVIRIECNYNENCNMVILEIFSDKRMP